MGVPKEIREVERPTNTIVCDNGKDTPFRYAVRERAASGKYVRGKFPQPKNGKVIGHIINLAQSLFLCDGSFLTYFLLLASMILRKKYSSSG